MRFIGSFLSGLSGLIVIASAVLVLTPASAFAQEDNVYRAEIVVLQRKVDPANIEEKMSDRHPEPAKDVNGQLWVVDRNGTRHSDLNLVPRNELYLSSAADRLERSGRFKILMAAGWVQAFPPDYKGERLKVAVGDWLDSAQQRAVEGYINIDRLRFLHVTVALNHWQAATSAMATADQPLPQSNPAGSQSTTAQAPIQGTSVDPALAATGPMNSPGLETNKQLLTWIRETRRMRSEEIHFLDSPTIGVLVFFKRIENEPAPAN